MKAVFGVAVAAAALWSATSATAQPEAIDGRECEIAVGAEAVRVQAEPVTVPLRHSEAVGDSVTASVPAESNIKIVGVGREEADEENTLRLVLNTSEAAAGTWPLTVKGTTAECSGTLNVVAADGDSR